MNRMIVLFFIFFSSTVFAIGNPVVVGAEQLDQYLPLLKNKQVALFANHTSLVNDRHLVDVLLEHDIRIVKIFSPEHGFRGDAQDGEAVKNHIDQKTGLPIISLYGDRTKPTKKDLAHVDIIVFDIQDVGVRFYTYISSLQRVMEAATEYQKTVIILDRPNPNGFYIDGPVSKRKSFTGLQPVPIVYGMTMGEYAKMLVGEHWLEVKPTSKANALNLIVIPNKNYTHATLYEPPVSPSPNLPSIQSIYWYPSIGLMEGTALSVGRGTSTPFQVFGHPELHRSFSFTPTSSPYKNQVCYGWDLRGSKEDVLRMVDKKLQIKYLMIAYQEFPNKKHLFSGLKFPRDKDTLLGQIQLGKTEAEIRQSWKKDLEEFKEIRKKYLIYAD